MLATVILVIAVLLFLPASLRFGKSTQVAFNIEKGEGLNTIAANLDERGLIRNSFLFKVYTTAVGQNKNLKAGTYTLSYSMSISDLVTVFSVGLANSDDVVVTIPEGSNINDVDIIFVKTGLTKPGQFLAHDFIELEGYLFPDTYNFQPGTNITDIVRKLRDNFETKTASVLRGMGAGDAKKTLIIASMLEKEVKIAEDMAIVSGIIQNRLKADMLLQIDATVAYGVCRRSFLVGRRCDVTQVNLIEAIKKDDPYNTYKNTGLPPGPISNPGTKAIYAALHLADTDYFYYLTDLAGKVYYARTSAEHAANRAKYLNK